jgi:hypothetical protein
MKGSAPAASHGAVVQAEGTSRAPVSLPAAKMCGHAAWHNPACCDDEQQQASGPIEFRGMTPRVPRRMATAHGGD